MYIVNVHVHVQPEHREGFIEAPLDNARNTIREPGNLRFDVLQELDDPNRFVIYEAYRDDAALAAHKASAHYARWAAAVNPWMAEIRRGVKLAPLFPEQPEQFRVQL
jgi:(4S)-4-hydroxy-5-phosphonooxypentane-2,3-dione isomerase